MYRIPRPAQEDGLYQYTTGGDPDIIHSGVIAKGGSGEVHKVIMLFDMFTKYAQMLDKRKNKVLLTIFLIFTGEICQENNSSN
jgi:hypothetical protein